MGKRLVTFGVISALLLAGCGRNGPTEPAQPIPVGDQTMAAPDDLGTSAMTELDDPAAMLPPATGDYGDVDTTGLPPDGTTATPTDVPTTDTTKTDTKTTAPVDTAAADAAAKAKADADAAAAAAKVIADADAAKAKADADAVAKKAEDDAAAAAAKKIADEAAALKAEKTPTFAKSIGEGSLHASFGIAVLDGMLYVVDNARTGLLGKFAAVRKYDIASGDYQQSFENIGWAGAKNLPTSVTRVKIVADEIVAANSTTSWTFDAAGAMVKSEDVTFAMPTQATDPDTGDTYKISGGKVDRIHDGAVILSFGDDQIDAGNSIYVDADGQIFVSEKNVGVVHMFAAPAK